MPGSDQGTPVTAHPGAHPGVGWSTSARTTRGGNLRRVLQTVLSEQPVSRAGVARTTGLTRATVSELVALLLDQELLYEAGEGPSSGGKPPTLLRVDSDSNAIVAVDLSDHRPRAAILDLEGTTREVVHGPDSRPTPGSVGDLIEAAVARSRSRVLGIGVAVSGVVSDGVVVQADNLGWTGVGLAELMTERTGLPVHVANDAAACALHEFGDDAHRRNAVVILVAEGLGAGIVLDGRIHLGDGHAAGEIGHLPVCGGDRPCRCGRRGCLETVASLPALLAAAGVASGGSEDDQVERLLASGRDDLFASAGRALGTVAASLIAVLDVHRLVIQGGIVGLGEPFVEPLRGSLDALLLPTLGGRLDLEIGRESRVLEGAWAVALAGTLGVTRR